MKRRLTLLISALLGCTAAVSVSTASYAAPTATPPDPTSPVVAQFIQQHGMAFLNNQADLETFKTWLVTRPGITTSGYLESIDAPATKSTTLLWHGAPTAVQRQIIQEGARRGIAVTVQQRQYGMAQINAAIAATLRSAAQGGWQGFRISSIAGITADFDGIIVNGSYTAVPAAQRAAQVRALATTTLGVAVKVVPSGASSPAVGRSTDTPPFNAGGLMIGKGTALDCSSGFGVEFNGAAHTTTARHCNAATYLARDNVNTVYGSSIGSSGDGAARVLSGSGSALAFDGAWNSVNYRKDVVGFGNVSLNDLVCTGGGNSGEHCNVKVDALSDWFDDGYGYFSAIHGTQQSAGQIAAINGDSGGPVITLASSTTVNAAGMIQGVDKFVSNCGPVHDLPNNACGTGVFFSSMYTIVSTTPGAELLVIV